MQYKSSESSRSSLYAHKKPSGFTQRHKPSVPRLGKSHEGFNVDSGFETSEFELIDFAEDVFNCQDEHPPQIIEEAAALFGLIAGSANRKRSTNHGHSRTLDPQKRNLGLFQTGRFQRRRNRSRVSFDFDLSHDPVDDSQLSGNHRRHQSRHSSFGKQIVPPSVAAEAGPPVVHQKMNWNRSDAAKALLFETKAIELLKSPHVLVLRFPDPELNKEIVQSYSTSIETVIFHRPSTPRYCLVHLKPDADVDSVIQQLSKISFGSGKIAVERKTRNVELKPTIKPEEIDPLTLFIGNLPNAVTVYTVKQMFPSARRIDIGHAQRMKNTRYAFIRFRNVHDAIGAFKANFNKVIDGKNIILRFRRHNAPIAMPEDTSTPKTSKRQKGAGQLFVSIEQKPNRCERSDKPKLEMYHSDTLNTIKTEILDEEIEKIVRHRVKIEPPEVPNNELELEESNDEDDIEDFLEDDEDAALNFDDINADENECTAEDDDTEIDALDKNYWTLEQLRSKASDGASTSTSDSKKSDILMEQESGTKTSSTTFNTTKPKDHKPATSFIVSKRRDDQLQDLFSCLEPDDDLSL
ncbi:uncharacterized protein LOC129767968 [Toxorhynchites rutilus septentrionalis]|uniref:uncharacterized protein LOC129767968 n=1 Tax=Toxorhynchites rutilus septentrionalis TaxID=329112 RepID=UPI0024798EF8|nr:uncharacterized protein LOC129767968 [Toxorhynchites rutilus septentrionalis]